MRVRAAMMALAWPLALAFTTSQTLAAPLYWDTNGDGTDATYGGDGTWDTVTANWNTSSTIGAGSLQTWDSVVGDLDSVQLLRGTAGNITVSGTHVMGGLTFGAATGSFTTGSSSYALTGGTLNMRVSDYSFVINNLRGNNSYDGTVELFGGITSTTQNLRQRINVESGLLTLGHVKSVAGFSGAGIHSLALESYSTGVTINGNITKDASAKAILLFIGGGGTSQGATYTLNGNNTGLGGVVTFSRGNLVLNHSGALSGATGLTVVNENVGAADTANVYIDTAGVSINKTVTFNTVPTTETTDIRTIGGRNTTGTATFAGTVNIGGQASSGNGSNLRVTALNAGATTVFSGNISDGGNTSSLLKTGLGIVKFTRGAGVNYDGGTTVSTGTLLANNTSGSGTGTGAVIVSSDAFFGGNGLITGDITLNAGGAFTAGDMDEMGVSTADSFDGASLGWNSDDSTVGMWYDLGTTSDLLTLTGNLTKGTGSTFLFNFEDAGGLTTTTYTLINFDSSTGFAQTDFDYTSSIEGLEGEFILNPTSLQFQVTAIPQPTSPVLLAAGLGLMMVFRRAGRRG